MIIVVSDVHLGYEHSNTEDFGRFLDKCKDIDISHLVLLGDILDLWRRNNAEVVKDGANAKVLNKLAGLNPGHLHYVIGNHDYYMLKLYERYERNFPFIVSRNLRLEDSGKKYYFIHGYELEVIANLEPLSIEDYEQFSEQMCFNNNLMGGFASKLWDIINCHDLPWGLNTLLRPPAEREKIDKIYDLATSEGKFMLLGMRPDEILVYGHTHRPFISEKKMAANTGSWVNELSRELSQNRYLKIADGEMSLRTFGVDEFP